MRQVFLCAVVLFLSGCVSSEMMSLGGISYPPRPDNYLIEVYTTTDAPVNILQEIGPTKPLSSVPSGATDIGRIDSHGAPAASWGKVIDDAKEKARTLGGDGLVIKSWASPLSHVDGYGNPQYAKEISTTVIRYLP
jgi:hypothetical protein